jgi:hypothetical protein
MHGDSISALLHHHLTVQCRLTSGSWAHRSVPGYAERTVGARSTASDGLPSAGEYKQGMELSIRIHTPILQPFAPISFVLCTCFPPRSPGREAGAGAAGAHGGPGAALSWEAGAGAVETHGSLGAAPRREAGAVVLT